MGIASTVFFLFQIFGAQFVRAFNESFLIMLINRWLCFLRKDYFAH